MKYGSSTRPKEVAPKDRLDDHFANLRSSSFKDSLKRSAGNWQFYAAVTGSAVAMATSASAAIIQNGAESTSSEPVANAVPANLHLASSRIPLMNLLNLNPVKLNPVKLNPLKLNPGPKTNQTAQGQLPSISPGGVVPVYGAANIIQPGEWVSIYGNNLASGTALWKGDFPTTLGNTTVTINGKLAYLLYVSPTQINLQAPNDNATGTVSVVVTTPAGSATATVTLSQFAPSFSLLDAKHVAGIILRKNGRGSFGGGTYDILGPTGNTLGYPTVAATPGDTVVLFGVGFGPTTPTVLAGQAFSGAAPLDASNPLTVYLNNGIVKPDFVGLSGAGVYQINLRIPDGAGYGDVPLQAMVGGVTTQSGVVLSMALPLYGTTGSGTVVTPPVSSHPIFTSFPTGTFSGGGASSAARKKRAFEPKKLEFPPK